MQSTSSFRSLLTAAVLVVVIPCALGQQTTGPRPTGWARVQTLPIGTNIHVKADKRSETCRLTAIAADSLTCTHGTARTVDTFQQSDIKKITVVHEGRSTLVGMIPGAILVIAGGIGAATRNCGNTQLLCGIGSAALIVLGTVVVAVGALIGYLTDFMGTTVYRRV